MTDFENSISKQQAKLDALRRELWPRFVEFKNGFFTELAIFTNETFFVGAKTVSPLLIDVMEDGSEHTHVTLNGRRLRFDYPTRPPETGSPVTEAMDTGKYAGALPAFEIRIYQESKGDGRLYGVVQAGYRTEEAFTYHIWQHMGARLVRNLGQGEGLTRRTGRLAASKLIRHFYSRRG
jgi:hypothetical protein